MSLVPEQREQRTKTHTLFVTFHIHNQSIFQSCQRAETLEGNGWTPFAVAREVADSCCRQFTNHFCACTREASSRAVRARVKECQALGGNIWPRTREPRSRVELEAKWCSTRASRRNIKRFRAFELPRGADDAEDRPSKEKRRERATWSRHVAPRARFVHPFRFVRLEMPNKRSSSLRDAIQRRFARLQTLHERTGVCWGN